MSARSLKKSRWSASISRMMPIPGNISRKLLVYSQASAAKYWLRPILTFPPMLSRIPPMERVGSVPALTRISEIMEVVVVFPCVPLTATGSLYPRMICPSRTDLVMCGIPSSVTAIYSGLSGLIAAVKTTRSMSGVMFSFFCPMMTRIPSAARPAVIAEAARSEPETSKPRLLSILARPLMEIPPIPEKKTWMGVLKSSWYISPPCNTEFEQRTAGSVVVRIIQ